VMSKPRVVAVLGGGISGLSSAHYLRERGFQVILAERDPHHLGGWLSSAHTPQASEKHHSFLFESGPRSLRSVGDAGRNTLHLVRSLPQMTFAL